MPSFTLEDTRNAIMGTLKSDEFEERFFGKYEELESLALSHLEDLNPGTELDGVTMATQSLELLEEFLTQGNTRYRADDDVLGQIFALYVQDTTPVFHAWLVTALDIVLKNHKEELSA